MNRDQAIRLAHVARRDLQIDEAAWRELLMGKFRVESSKDLSLTQLYTLVEHLKKCGLVRFLREKPEVNKEAILAEPAAVAGVAEIKVITGVEDFSVTPFEIEVA